MCLGNFLCNINYQCSKGL